MDRDDITTRISTLTDYLFTLKRVEKSIRNRNVEVLIQPRESGHMCTRISWFQDIPNDAKIKVFSDFNSVGTTFSLKELRNEIRKTKNRLKKEHKELNTFDLNSCFKDKEKQKKIEKLQTDIAMKEKEIEMLKASLNKLRDDN